MVVGSLEGIELIEPVELILVEAVACGTVDELAVLMSSCVGPRANLCSEPCVALGNGGEGTAGDGVASGWDLEGDGSSLCSVMVGVLWGKGGGAVLQYPLSLCGEDGKTRNGLGVDSNGEGAGGGGTSGRGEGGSNVDRT